MSENDVNPYRSSGELEQDRLSTWRRMSGLALYVAAGLVSLVAILAMLGAIRWTIIESREGIIEHRLSNALFLLVVLSLAVACALVWAGRLVRGSLGP